MVWRHEQQIIKQRRNDKITNEYLQGIVGLVNITGKSTERRLEWFGHVTLLEDDHWKMAVGR